MLGERRCATCNVVKDVNEFWTRRDRRGVARLWRSACKACAARLRARLARVPFEIEIADIHIPPKCPVLDVPLVLHRGRRGPRDSSPTLDRIVPSLGYVRGNIIVVSWRANR